ncbi:MAG: hypothetical protein ACFE9M_05310 [Promethearchaeota archaeon]
MNTKEFMNQLNKVQELMDLEKYKEAIILLDKLKEIEKNSNLNYDITHRLYQLDSNSRSLYNQQIILKQLSNISKMNYSISFHELNQVLKEKNKLELSNDILRREIEILILRNLLTCRIDGERLVF